MQRLFLAVGLTLVSCNEAEPEIVILPGDEQACSLHDQGNRMGAILECLERSIATPEECRITVEKVMCSMPTYGVYSCTHVWSVFVYQSGRLRLSGGAAELRSGQDESSHTSVWD